MCRASNRQYNTLATSAWFLGAEAAKGETADDEIIAAVADVLFPTTPLPHGDDLLWTRGVRS